MKFKNIFSCLKMNKSTYEKILIEVVLIHAWRGQRRNSQIYQFTIAYCIAPLII